ncbi:MAG: SIMPL domain-containing protein [Ignavibacteria bacterium]|nr:SIMPL domain-containing protein [Ignavibacteria bacterium]
MKIPSIVLMMSMIMTAGACAQAPNEARTIHVHGIGVVTTPPDQVRLTVQVNTRESSASAAMRAASSRSRDILALLGSYGVNTKDIQTTRVTVTPVFDYEKRIQPAPIIGYTGTNEFTVLFREKQMERTGEFMDKAVTAGASGFGGLGYESSLARNLEREALVKAAADAKARAEVLAKELGAGLGRVKTVSESVSSPSPIVRAGAFAEMRSTDVAAPVMSGELMIKAEVNVVFELQ